LTPQTPFKSRGGLGRQGFPPALDLSTRVEIVRPDACPIRLDSGQELVERAEDRARPIGV
jgi:hypothetical protein